MRIALKRRGAGALQKYDLLLALLEHSSLECKEHYSKP